MYLWSWCYSIGFQGIGQAYARTDSDVTTIFFEMDGFHFYEELFQVMILYFVSYFSDGLYEDDYEMGKIKIVHFPIF